MEDKKSEASRRMKQEETQRERKLYYSKSITLYLAFMNIVLGIHKLITALPKFKIENALKAGTSSHIVSIPT